MELRPQAVLFGGTTEGRELAHTLAARGFAVAVSVATSLGAEELGANEHITVHCGRLTAPEMARLLRGARVCIDATHPYAVEASQNIRAAARQVGVEYLRLARALSELPAGCMVFADAAEAARWLAERPGNVLLATGAKELAAFACMEPARLYPRVLPTHESLTACEAAGIPHRNIIAMQGPFSQAMNEALLRQFAIRYLVTKDGGAAGGFAQKVAAAAAVGAQLLVVRRPPEQGSLPLPELLQRCEEAKTWQ